MFATIILGKDPQSDATLQDLSKDGRKPRVVPAHSDEAGRLLAAHGLTAVPAVITDHGVWIGYRPDLIQGLLDDARGRA
ncbi:hypothetical protein [Bifidobacterium biavatii]|uniref:Glutaredoxin n=1 Tax=Bifidobacterium biavatii DSM 23969 TaxID=1437608 RepID=A0A086ZHW1_9BIFI|nr:hypothetical protein [Bifidobacterium biavatii]KFI46111.1 hypothetical protein BBIA_2076 [Bifidobacterium biavatii DSM 23969]